MAVFSKFAVSVAAVVVGYEEESLGTASALQMNKIRNVVLAAAALGGADAKLNDLPKTGVLTQPIFPPIVSPPMEVSKKTVEIVTVSEKSAAVSKEVSKEVQEQICSALKDATQLEEAKSLLKTGSADGKLLTRLKEALPDASADNLAKVAELLAGLDVGKFEETWNICRDAAIADARFDALYQDLIICTPNKGSSISGFVVAIIIVAVVAIPTIWCCCKTDCGGKVHCGTGLPWGRGCMSVMSRDEMAEIQKMKLPKHERQ